MKMFDENYAIEPAYLLLVELHKNNPEINDKEQQQFFLATERLIKRKIPSTNKQKAKKLLKDCIECLRKQGKEEKKFDAEQAILDFKANKPYIEPVDYKMAKNNSLKAFKELRDGLRRCFNPKEIKRITNRLDLPNNHTTSLFTFLITGNQRLDRFDKVLWADIDTNKPKMIFTANATRDDFDVFMKEQRRNREKFTQLNRRFPKLNKPINIKPYYFTHKNGQRYVAVDVYRSGFTKIRDIFKSKINTLQSRLPGYHFKAKIRKRQFQRDKDFYRGAKVKFPTEDARDKANKRFHISIQ